MVAVVSPPLHVYMTVDEKACMYAYGGGDMFQFFYSLIFYNIDAIFFAWLLTKLLFFLAFICINSTNILSLCTCVCIQCIANLLFIMFSPSAHTPHTLTPPPSPSLTLHTGTLRWSPQTCRTLGSTHHTSALHSRRRGKAHSLCMCKEILRQL